MKRYYAELTMQANKTRISNGLECNVTLTLLVTVLMAIVAMEAKILSLKTSNAPR